MKRITRLAAAALASTVAFGAAAEQYTAAVWMGPTHPLTVGSYEEWAAKVAEESGGEITFEVFTGGSLYPPASSLTATADGLSVVGYVVANYTPSELPATSSVGDIGFAHPDPYVLASAMADFLINDEQIRNEWLNNGVVATSGYSTPAYYFICTDVIASLEDLKGKKIRAPNAGYSRLATALGAVPVSIAASEIYTAFDRGALDCTSGDPTFLTSGFQVLDIVKSMVGVPMSPTYTGALHAFDLDFWRGLSDEQRRILIDNEAFATAVGLVRYNTDLEAAMATARENLELPEPGEDYRAAIAQFIEDNKAASIEAATALNVENPEALLERFLEYSARWAQLYEGVDRTDLEAVTALLKENIYDKVDETTFGME